MTAVARMKQVVRIAFISNLLLLAPLPKVSAHPVCSDPARADIYIAQWIEALMLAKCGPDLLRDKGKIGEMGCNEVLGPLKRVGAETQRRFDIEDPSYPDRNQTEEYCEIHDEERTKHPF